MNKFLLIFFYFIVVSFAFSQDTELSNLVNPFIGTGGNGHTYPGATMPFGMVQLSPDTRLSGWEGCSGYHRTDTIVYGFTHTHLSGTGCSDYGDILLMPTIGKINYKNSEYSSRFNHVNEKATPGFYSVLLDKYRIGVKLTATRRAGFHKYNFPQSKNANIIIDLMHRDEVIESSLEIVSNTEIKGMRRSKAWAKDQPIYFYMKFSKPFTATEILIDDNVRSKAKTCNSKNIKASVTFETTKNEAVFVKLGISTVSMEGALKNLDAEIPDWDFDKTKANTQNEWNKELGKIIIEGGTDEQRTVFYTALYHTMIVPNLNMDVDGQYRGMDNKIHIAEGFTYYSVFSLWDTFRAAHPLYTLIDRKRTLDFIKTFLVQFQQGGRLPIWELSSNETDCMIGYHSVSVILDALVKGIADFDKELAFTAMKKSATWNHLGLPAFIDHGFLAIEDEPESVSKTLEYSYDDWCIAQMAKILDKPEDYKNFIIRAQSYKNIFDKETGFMRPRKNGNWLTPFDPKEVNNHFTEANSWQYSFFVPQDISGLISLFGSAAKFETKLDELFATVNKTTGRSQVDITGLLGQYAHGNEPSHHMAYLYDFVGKPWKTQQYIHKIISEMYHSLPDGLIGNEDCGQMSAWYVLSALGIYSVTPGIPEFAIGTPLFSEAKINLENGNIFTIKANNISDKNFYIQSALLNEKPYFKSVLKYSDIIIGGSLKFEMGNNPAKEFGVGDGNSPVSLISDNLIVPVPVIRSKGVTFKENEEISMEAFSKNLKIFYTLDESKPGSDSKVYTVPFKVDKTTTVKAIAVNEKGERSSVVKSVFYKFPNAWKIKINSKYNKQYNAGSDEGIIDGIRGDINWRKGEWQGYQDTDFEAVIDLGKEQAIGSLSAGFLQDSRSWVLYPKKLVISFSKDGLAFTNPLETTHDISPKDETIQVREFVIQTAALTKARYVKVKAFNFGKLPEWHAGAGDDAFIFIDEITIK